MSTFYFFGDSITEGMWDTEGGWVERLRKDVFIKVLDSSFVIWHRIYNLGVSGNNTQELILRFENEIIARKDEEQELVIIIGIGINDSQVYVDGRGTRVSFETFQSNIQSLINVSKKYTSKIIFVGLTPVNESMMNPNPSTPEKGFVNESIKKFNDAIKEICKKENILFVNFYDDWIKVNYKELLSDGLHPNTEGHKRLYNKVKECFEKENIL